MKTKTLPSLLQKRWLSYSTAKAQTQAVYESTLEFEYEGNTTRWHKTLSNSLGLLQELSLIQHRSNTACKPEVKLPDYKLATCPIREAAVNYRQQGQVSRYSLMAEKGK